LFVFVLCTLPNLDSVFESAYTLQRTR
jgi:hypothetical protein